MRWICTLFGHTGKETESGYHVCSRCGEHEYFSAKENNPYGEDYFKAAIITEKLYRISRFANRVFKKIIPLRRRCLECGKPFWSREPENFCSDTCFDQSLPF